MSLIRQQSTCQNSFFCIKMFFMPTFWHKYEKFFLSLHTENVISN